MKVRALALDVTQYYYNLPPEVKAIRECYAYDPESATHLCELTPSHYLVHLYTDTECTAETDDDRREELQALYCYQGSEDIYMHVSDVRKLRTVDAGDFETMDDAREHLCGNWVVP